LSSKGVLRFAQDDTLKNKSNGKSKVKNPTLAKRGLGWGTRADGERSRYER